MYFAFFVLCWSGTLGVNLVPDYVWPLGNVTATLEVMEGHDASMPESGQCFEFVEGYTGLPYLALRLNGEPESYIDISLDGTTAFKDIALSLYLYPEGISDGTLVHYLYDTGNIIRVSIMESILFVSFWDEYSVSVGATALPEVLIPNQWNHLVVSRDFATGTIAVYHNGVLMEELDDDFPNNIQLPTSGELRLGRSHDKTGDGFVGRLTCFQLFGSVLSESDVVNIANYCQPDSWFIKPELIYKETIIDGVAKQCLSNVTEIKSVREEPSCIELVSLSCLSNSYSWNQVKDLYQWNDSSGNEAYFSLISTGFLPSNSNGHLQGNVITTDRKVCARLCMRVYGCESYAFTNNETKTTKCILYDAVQNATEEVEGARYFAIRN